MKQTIAIIVAGSAALLFGLYLSTFGLRLPGQQDVARDSQIDGLFWPRQKQIGEFSMVDHNGDPFGLSGFEKHWNLLFFGYTHCPDICPTTLSVLREASALIRNTPGNPWNDTRVIFASVDGERDTPEHLARYIAFFDPSFIALTGNRQQVDSLTTELGIPFEIEAHTEGEDYLVSHTGSLFLISPEGKLAAIYQAPHTAAALANRYMEMREFIRERT